jgi:hypothetical protein
VGFPEQERFTLADVAIRLDKRVSYVKDMVRTLQFTHIIVVGELIGGSSLTRHLYFDRALWTQGWGKPERRKIERKEQKRNKIFADHHAKAWKETFGTEAPFEPILKTAREECVYRTFYNIGPNEVANLWCPYPPQEEWTRPKGHVQVYIPRSAVEAFKQKHGLPEEAKTNTEKKKDRSPAPDLSTIMPMQWYATRLAARYLGMTEKYLQNDLIPSGKLKAQKRGRRNEVQGQEILNYAKKYHSTS